MGEVMIRNRWIRKFVIIAFWLAIWQLISMFIDNSIVLVGPLDVIRALFRESITIEFWSSILYSFGKISLGFLTAFLLGILLGSFAYRFQWLKELLEPIIMIIKSIPVASFVILALIWMGSKNLSIIISFLVVFPIIYINTIAGLDSTDHKLLEMAQVFRIPIWKRIKYIYRVSLLPYLISGCKVALGMSWKSGIAAEVIGVPDKSIGERLYMSKIYLSTDELFAWTVVIILISALFEKLFLTLLRKLQKDREVQAHEN